MAMSSLETSTIVCPVDREPGCFLTARLLCKVQQQGRLQVAHLETSRMLIPKGDRRCWLPAKLSCRHLGWAVLSWTELGL